MAPRFLDVEKIFRIHRSVIEAYGGSEGLRDAGLLQSAVATAQATFGGRFLHGDRFEMAAAYLYHIVQNHPFVDGNKRTGAAAAIIFLAMNDIAIRADEDGLFEMTIGVAEGRVGKDRVAQFFRERAEGVEKC